MEMTHLGVEEWEAEIGRQIRSARIAQGLDQTQLAERSNVAIATISNLERGKGSSLRSLISVVRALDRTEWLRSLAGDQTISPMQMLRAKQRTGSVPQRVRHPRPARPS